MLPDGLCISDIQWKHLCIYTIYNVSSLYSSHEIEFTLFSRTEPENIKRKKYINGPYTETRQILLYQGTGFTNGNQYDISLLSKAKYGIIIARGWVLIMSLYRAYPYQSTGI